MIAIYARVSTQEQALNGYSIDEQIERMEKYCDSFGWKIYKKYVDAGFSGANINRPALQTLIKDVGANKVDKVLVYKLDRLSRSQKDTLYLIEDVFLKNNVDFSSMNENFDTASAFGRAMIGILSVFAQLEREQIKERSALGREGRAKEGKYHGGGWIPIGYEYINDNLVVNDYEAMQIRELHKLYQQGKSLREIAKIMADKGFTHKNGNWSPNRIKIALRNDLYIGNVHFGGQTYKGVHEPIIDEHVFNLTAKIFNSHDYSACKNHGNKTYLASLLFCKRCGARYGSNVSRFEYKYYSCYSRRKQHPEIVKDPNCKNKNYRSDVLEKIIFDEIRKLALDTSKLADLKTEDNSEKISLLLKEIEKIDAQRSRLIDLYSIGSFTSDEITAKIAPLSEKRNKLEKEINSLKSSALSVTDATKMIQSFDDILATGDFDKIRQILLALIDRIEIDGDDIFIHWKFC